MGHVFVPKVKRFDLKHDAVNVILELDGKHMFSLHWQNALELGKAFIQQAKNVEQLQCAPGIINDQALLMRKGVPLILSKNKDILSEAVKESNTSRKLRRAAPKHEGGSIKSKARFGTPTLEQKKPPK